MSDKRVDPEDGKAYTREELGAFYKGTYGKKEIAAYWDGLKPAKSKGSGKGEKTVAAPKAKVKAKAKAKVKKVTKEIAVGDKIGKFTLFKGFEKVELAESIAEKKVIITGLPGAFTPTCSEKHVPSFLKDEAELKAKGIDEIIIFAVDDGAVMAGWKKALGVKDDSMCTFLGDPYLHGTRKMGLLLSAPMLKDLGLGLRCKRFTLVVDKGEVKHVAVAGGDIKDDVTFSEATLAALA